MRQCFTVSLRWNVRYGRLEITSHDYQTLAYGEFVNDAIINFYLEWLFDEKLAEEQRKEVHIFATQFYQRLKR